MQDTWFCSDLHLNHKNILKFQPNRLFETLEEHDNTLIDNWNRVVKKHDSVWFLGDFAFCSQTKALEYIDRLNGHIYFIKGNHDMKVVKNINFRNRLNVLDNYFELKGFHKLPIVLSHYPFQSWNRSFHGSYHFHGHCHGGLDTASLDMNRRDVGIDSSWNQRPFHIDELIMKVHS